MLVLATLARLLKLTHWDIIRHWLPPIIDWSTEQSTKMFLCSSGSRVLCQLISCSGSACNGTWHTRTMGAKIRQSDITRQHKWSWQSTGQSNILTANYRKLQWSACFSIDILPVTTHRIVCLSIYVTLMNRV